MLLFFLLLFSTQPTRSNASIRNIKFNQIPKSDFGILKASGLRLEPLTKDILSGVRLRAVSGLGYMPNISFSSLESLDENTTFGELSRLITEDYAHLFRHKNLDFSFGLTVKNIQGLNQSDYKALDYVGRYGGIFDPDFYLKEYPLVARSSINPLTHYVTYSQQYSYLARNSVLRQPDQILIASTIIDTGVRPPNPLETIVGLFVLGGKLTFDAATGAWEFFRETSTDDILQAFRSAGEGLTIAPGVNLIDVSLINPNNTPPFIIPAGTEEGEITIEVFPGGVNVEEILDGSIFVSPDASEIEFSGVVTTPKQTQDLDELLENSVFTFPGDTEPAGSYFYSSSSISVEGTPDTPEELPQSIRLAELEGGGTIKFLDGIPQGIEGYFVPSGGTIGKPFSLKNFSKTGKLRNIIGRINDNKDNIQKVGITDPVLLRIEMTQFSAAEIKNFVDNGPIKNMPLEGVFEKIYFDASDGTVVVDSTGTYLR